MIDYLFEALAWLTNKWILWSFISCYVLWGLYILVMSLRRVKALKGLTLASKILGTPLLIVGYILDALVNVFVFSVVLWEKPKVLKNADQTKTKILDQEWLVTPRLCRHIRSAKNTWGKRVAMWLGPNLLDDYDHDGKHIK